ncbi:MAG: hypothetical protein LBE89_04770 [Helicobacteraceae bacterium]|jgi:hypothetical protein|nr:hypothetical protein [Helicobacteraceae bacterium]
MNRNVCLVALSVVALGFSGCATLVNDATQPVVVNTSGSNAATVTVTYDGGVITGKTPLLVPAKRSSSPLTISVNEDKCVQATTFTSKAKVSGAFFVNAIWCFGCVLSTTVDMATGRMWKYDDQVFVPVTREPDCKNNS